jgi:GYF domain 2
MATQYETLRAGRLSGPFTAIELRQLVMEGRLDREDKIRACGSTDWQPARRYRNLFVSPSDGSSPTEVGLMNSNSKSGSGSQESLPTLPGRIAEPAKSFLDVKSGAGADARPPVSQLAMVAALGVVVTLGLSLLKPHLGAIGIFGVAAAVGLVLTGIVFIMRSAITPLVAHLGAESPAVALAKSRLGRVTWLGCMGVLVCGTMSLTEFLTPQHGLTRSILALAAPKPPDQPPPQPSKPTMDSKAWARASFVLVNPKQDAVGVYHDADRQMYQTVALATGEEVQEAMKLAIENDVQLIDEKPELAHRLATLSELGPVPGRLANELGELWKVHQYLPTKATLVTFQDVKEGKSRVGFVTGRRGEEISLVPLSPKRIAGRSGDDQFVTEVIRRADIRTGSQRVDLNDAQVKEVADFLDYTVYRILDKLGTSQRGAGYVRVVVEPVRYDDTKLKNIKEQGASLSEKYLREIDIKGKHNIVDETVKARRKGQINARQTRQSIGQRYSQQNGARQYGSSFGEQGTIQRGMGQTDTQVDFEEAVDVIKNRSIRGDAEAKKFLREFDLEEKRLRDMESETGTVTSELRTRLNNAGVSVLEKSRLDALDAERDLARRSGSLSSSAEQYLGATHILIAEIRDRRGPGQYHLSTRLVKVGTREIVAEVEGERTPPLSIAYKPPAETPFLLRTGQLVVVEFTDDVRPRNDLGYRSYPGGYPVSLPFTGLIPLSDDDRFLEHERLRILKIRGSLGPGGKVITDTPPILEGMNKRIGFLDDPSAPDPKQSPFHVLVGMDLSQGDARKGLSFDRVPFRDLFGSEPVQIELNKIKSISEVTSNLVPEAHRMRFVVYQIASSILPTAGRITTRGDGDLHTVSLGHQSGLQVSDHLRVMRPGLSDRLEFELQVREVENAFARVAFDKNESLFTDSSGPQVGDLVYRRTDSPIRLAVLPFTVEDTRPGMNNNVAPRRGGRPGINPLMQRGMIANGPPQRGRVAQRNFNQEKTTGEYIAKLAHELAPKLSEALNARCNVPLAAPGAATHVVMGTVTYSSDKDYLFPAHLRVMERATGKILREIDFKFAEQEGRNWKP